MIAHARAMRLADPPLPYAIIAQQLGVNKSTVLRALSGATWGPPPPRDEHPVVIGVVIAEPLPRFHPRGTLRDRLKARRLAATAPVAAD